MSESEKKIRQVASVQAPVAFRQSHTGYESRAGRSRSGDTLDSTLDQKSDEVLITLFQQGDESVFRILVDRYKEKLRNLIFSIFNESEIVDDLAQEVFIKAYEALPNFRFQSSFYTWLYRIAVNRSRDEMRKRKIRKWLPLDSMMESRDEEFHDKMTTQPDSGDARELVSRGLQQLPEKFRFAIILKDIDGLSYEQMADVLQCEIGTVKSRLSRARAMLRTALKPLMDDV